MPRGAGPDFHGNNMSPLKGDRSEGPLIPLKGCLCIILLYYIIWPPANTRVHRVSFWVTALDAGQRVLVHIYIRRRPRRRGPPIPGLMVLRRSPYTSIFLGFSTTGAEFQWNLRRLSGTGRPTTRNWDPRRGLKPLAAHTRRIPIWQASRAQARPRRSGRPAKSY